MKVKTEDKGKSPIISSIIFGVLMLALSLSFYYTLHTKTGAPFGWLEISFSLAMAVLFLAFLQWATLIMRSNKYLGIVVGIVGLVTMIYALFLRYKGRYTMIFAIIGSVIYLIFLGLRFWQNRNNK